MTHPGPEHFCPECGVLFKAIHYLRPERLFTLWCPNNHRWTLPDVSAALAVEVLNQNIEMAHLEGRLV